MLFLAIFTHFLCTKFHKNSLSLQKWQYLPLKEILGNLMQRKCQKMAKNSIFWPKNSYFWPFLYGRQHQIARSGEYWYSLMTGEFLWNLDQRKWVKMAKNSIFWHKKLRQIFLALGICPKSLGVVIINIFEWLESFCEILIRGSGLKWPKIAFFGIKSCAKSNCPKIWPDKPY